MLRDEIAKYTELSGNDGEHTSIGIIGAYLDGYEKGLEENLNKCFEGMTNGEVFMSIFPDVVSEIDAMWFFGVDWWSAPKIERGEIR